MAGRTRKAGKRRPNGRLVSEKRPDDRLRVASQPHRRGLVASLRADERAESPLGRALLRGLIDQSQFDAGTRFAVVVGEYRAVIGAPRSQGGSGRGYDCMPDGCDPEQCACLRCRKRYMDAYEALAVAGRKPLLEVIRVAVHNDEISDAKTLYVGLRAMAEHFGLTSRNR